ncbi:4Fe-4S dicluster domain-containing protein [Lacihabitans sp. LS3-19]|nr:4Fe-4S dicluster domain-containing protein [Lacihabitans sp. LS3-19]
MTYFQNIKRGIKTTRKGLSLTLKHLWAARKTKGPLNVQDENYFKISDGFVTLQYPHETISVPEIGRYQLDCEIDDCIVCDKCAKICPVDCIDIEAIKSPELIRTTSDGSPVRLYAAKFDIDMAKCCFCGLCTTVCPTECLTMNSEYDYSVTDVDLLNFAFSNLSAKEAEEKKELYEQFVAEKEAAKAAKAVETAAAPQPSGFKPKIPSAFQPKAAPSIASEENNTEATEKPITKKPIFAPKKPVLEAENVSEEKPKFIPKRLAPAAEVSDVIEADMPVKSAPKFVPKAKTVAVTPENTLESEESNAEVPVKPAPKFVPKAKPVVDSTENGTNSNEANAELPVKTAPKFVPKAKPVAATPENTLDNNVENAELLEKATLKFVPKAKPVIAESTISEENVETEAKKTFMPKAKPTLAEDNNLSETPKPTPAFKPKMKPAVAEEEKAEAPIENKPKFVPKLKPKS